MCEICRRSPCHPRCPNAPDPIPVYLCAGFGHDIYEGELYWDVLGEQFCENCIDDARTEAEDDLVCFVCEETIYAGQDYYNIMGKTLCERCINDAKREARFEYDEDYHFDI